MTVLIYPFMFFFSSRRRHTRFKCDWSSDVCSSDLGIPPSPARKSTGSPPSFVGFLYASAGFALLFAALDQGQRLDWWRSGLFNGLFFSAVIFLLASLVRRLRSPNPLVDLPYLRQWNTIVLGVALGFFRFCLLATIILIPQALALHGFEADQIGPALLWTALPQFLIAFIAALLLLHGKSNQELGQGGPEERRTNLVGLKTVKSERLGD